MEHNPYKTLVATLGVQMSKVVAGAVSGVPGELGTITATGLKLDNFKHEIQDYLVAEYLTLDKTYMTETETDGDHVHGTPPPTGAHMHQVKTPVPLQPLKAGDRVLVTPIRGGQDYVVIARVVKPGA